MLDPCGVTVIARVGDVWHQVRLREVEHETAEKVSSQREAVMRIAVVDSVACVLTTWL